MFPNLEKWTRPSHYIGPDHYGYYVGLGRNRDSDLLTISNFEVLLERLGGESDDDETPAVQVIRDRHWAVGWVEYILVHETAADKLRILSEALESIDDYPILDEDDFNERETEAQEDYFRDCRSEFVEAVCEAAGIEGATAEQEAEAEQVASAVYFEDCGCRGFEDAFVDEGSVRRMFESTYSEAPRLVKQGNSIAALLLQKYGKAA
jgi:hypothetical protein